MVACRTDVAASATMCAAVLLFAWLIWSMIGIGHVISVGTTSQQTVDAGADQ